jgi:hypothetical protein
MTFSSRIKSTCLVSFAAIAIMCVVILVPVNEPFESLQQYLLIQTTGLSIALLLVATAWFLVPKNSEEARDARVSSLVTLCLLLVISTVYSLVAIKLHGFTIVSRPIQQFGETLSSFTRLCIGVVACIVVYLAVHYQIVLLSLRSNPRLCSACGYVKNDADVCPECGS